MAASQQPPDLTGAFFAVQIAGIGTPGVTRVEFLPAERDRPRQDAERIVLRLTRQLTHVSAPTTEFLRWVQHSDLPGAPDRRDVSIGVYDAFAVERGRVTLASCLALTWGGPLLSSDAVLLTESIDLRCASARLSGAF